jgi:hypothetical protein
MAYRYIPMIKAKAGEIDALRNLSAQARARVLPLIHIGESLSPRFAPQIGTFWAGQMTVVDGSFNFQHSGSLNDFTTLVSALRQAGIPTMPSVGMSDPQIYQQAALSLADSNGAVVKASPGSLASLPTFLSGLSLNPGAVDLIIDVKHVASIDVPSYAGYLVSVFTQNAAILTAVRSVALAAGSAPKDHSSLNYGPNLVPRTDWLVWNAVRSNVPFQLDYGDYLTGHPDLTEPPGVAMASATVSARYTLDSYWLIIKGRSTGGPYGQPMGVQNQAHAGIIIAHQGFGGLNAWADGQITQAAAGAPKMGSRQKWAGFAANRHIELVANRLP